MPSVGTLVQVSGACSSQPCGGAVGYSFTCASRNGSGNIRGWSKFQNHNTGDVNLRKYTRYDQAGDAILCAQEAGVSGCSVGVAVADQRFAHREILSGFATWNVATNAGSFVTATLRDILWRRIVDGDGSSCDGSGGSDDTFSAIDDILFVAAGACSGADTVTNGLLDLESYGAGADQCTPLWSFSIGDTVKTASGLGCVGIITSCPCGGGEEEAHTTGATQVSLATPDTVQAALARASVSPGTLCKTTLVSVGSTTARSTTQIAVNATAVTVTISLTGLTTSTAYTITANINRYTAGGGALFDATTAEIDFTADGASDTVDYEVPVNSDFDYEFASIASVVAA